jgi:lysine 2,3-aminomutase
MNDDNAGSIVASPDKTLLGEAEEPPGSRTQTRVLFSSSGHRQHGKRHPAWHNVPDEQWSDWRWQRQHAIRTADQLAELLPLPPDEVAALRDLESKYRTAIPPYYFSLIDVADPLDPIRLQSVPSSKEEANLSGVEFDDPLEEDKDSPVPGVTHRYPDRALLITTPVCSMYCRFCTRKRVTMDRDGWDAPSRDEQRMIEYVRATPAIHDVILSGGDPLTLPVAKLRWFLQELAAIDHVDVIRVGTRVPVTLPQRLFDPELVDLLAGVGKVWIQTHFNHPVEITPEATLACRNLVNAGMPVNNHSVLMRGVNDSVATMRELVRGLLRIKVRPYYIFHCDPVTGAGHFRTSVWKGIEIIEGLRGHVSGLGVPTYVVDGLHGAGKIPVMPNYMLSSSDDAVILRNYEGMIFRYAPEDKPSVGPKVPSVGVSNVLSGGAGPLVPADNPRHQRRKKKLAGLTPDSAKALPTPSKHPARPLIGSRAANGKAIIVAATGKTNGSRLRLSAAAVRFDSVASPGDLLMPSNTVKANGRTAKASAGAANGSTNGKPNGHKAPVTRVAKPPQSAKKRG